MSTVISPNRPRSATRDQASSTPSEPWYTVRELSEMGFGHPQTIREWLHEDDVPFEVIDGRGTIGVLESTLPRLRKPLSRHSTPLMSGRGPTAKRVTDLDDLALIAAQMVASWPRLTSERKAELRQLLAS